MGEKFLVCSWINKDESGNNYAVQFEYELVYAGDSFDDAVRTMKEEKSKGVGCVKLEWRQFDITGAEVPHSELTVNNDKR